MDRYIQRLPKIFQGTIMKKSILINFCLILTISLSLIACGGAGDPSGQTGSGNNTQTGTNNAANSDDCNSFGGSIENNEGVTFSCVDQAGALYEMKFDGNGRFDWYFITTGDFPIRDAEYSVEGDQIRLFIPGFDINGGDFDETSTRTVVKLGMLAGFATPRISCGAIRHDYDQNTMDEADYSCSPYSAGPGVTHHPVFRLGGIEGTNESPLYNQNQPGNAFWSTQKDIAGSIVNEDFYGIYRQIGNKVCMYFPGAPSDKQEVEATFSNDLSELSVDRSELNQNGACRRI